MRKKMFAFLMIALVVGGLYAQVVPDRTEIYTTSISLNSQPKKVAGSLCQVNDSSVIVSSSLRLQDYTANRFKKVELHFENIETIKIRRKNSVGNGALIGAISGLTFGGLIGYASGDDSCPSGTWCSFTYTAEAKALMLGVPFSIVGAGIGALIGSAKIVIPINGSNKTFNQNKNNLREYSIIK
jgi:hypothetical protein